MTTTQPDTRGAGDLPQGVASAVPYLGPYGCIETLVDEGLVDHSSRTPRSLPRPARTRGAFTRRSTTAIAEIVDTYPVGHLIIPSDRVLRAAVGNLDFEVPTTTWLPSNTDPAVQEFLGKTVPGYMDVAVLPENPRSRGGLPVFVTLGVLTRSLCLVPPAAYAVLMQFGQRGLTVLIDPSDLATEEMLPWPRLWTSSLDRVFYPAENEVADIDVSDSDPSATDPPSLDVRPGGRS